MDISLTEDLIKIIEQLIIYEEMEKQEEIDNFQYEYAYINDVVEEKEKQDWKIEISM